MSSQKFTEFYRQHGTRRVTELPDLDRVAIKSLPNGSAIHYLGDSENPKLDISDPLMLGYSADVRCINITQYSGNTTGGLRKLLNMTAVDALFNKTSRGFKVLRSMAGMVEVPLSQLVTFNYGYLEEAYSYPNTVLARYNKIQNKLITLGNTILEANKIVQRNHFIVLDVPANLLPVTILDKNVLATPMKQAAVFRGEDELLLRQFWLMINPENFGRSIFGVLPQSEYPSVTFLFKMFDGKYAVLNLAYLLSWVKGQVNLTEMKTPLTKPFKEVQKFFLRGEIVLQSVNANGASVRAQEDAQNLQAKKLEEADRIKEEASEQDDRFLQDQDHADSVKDIESQIKSDFGKLPATKDAKLIKINLDKDTLEEPEINIADIDGDLAALEQVYMKRMSSSLKKMEAVSELHDFEEIIPEDTYTSDVPEDVQQIKDQLFTNYTPEQALSKKLDKLVDEGRVSAAEFRKKTDLIQKASKLPDPYGSDKTIGEASVVTKEELEITVEDSALTVPESVIDKSMAFSTLNVMNEKYNTKTIYKDMLAVVQGVQKGGVVVRNHQVDTQVTAMGTYDIHTLELAPLNGMPSSIRCKVPKAFADGTFVAKGNKYVLRRQFVDLPIRKIGPNRVGLTSYYGKTFIDRGTKKANSSLEYVITRLNRATIQPDEYLRDVAPGDVFDNYFEAPYFYSGLSSFFVSFKAGDLTLDFNPKGFRATLDPGILKTLEKDGARICGWVSSGVKALVVIDKTDHFHVVYSDRAEPIGDIYDVLKIDKRMVPVDYAEIKIFSKSIPVAIFLGQTIGLRKLIKVLGAKHRIVEGRQAKRLEEWEYPVQFRDISYIFDKREPVNSLILAGFNMFDKEIKRFDASLFDDKDVYLQLLTAKYMSAIYLSEMENLQDMFIDPITERILKQMGEPTTFNGLIMRACELLRTYYYPDSQDANYQRIRGYDRFAGFFYKELVASIRSFKARNRTGRAKVDMSPFQLWSTITRDSAVKHAEDINPIQALKISQEAVTYVGEGGRSKESMNKQSRAYTKSNLGTLSADSVDSSDVGINAFLSADPGFSDTYGMVDKDRPMGPANLLSTSSLLAPYAVKDDPKRRGFIGIQQGHTIFTEGAEAPMVRTGYESVVGMRAGAMFAQVAKGTGEVISVSPKGVLVKYDDGETVGYPLGTLYGKAEGSMYPHNLISEVVPGQKVKKDDYITYNSNFFQKDPVLPGGIIYKGSLIARVVLMESPHTHEDSSAISRSLGKRMSTTTTKMKQFTVNFKQNVSNIVKMGQKVRPEDILMTIEDEITSSDNSFNNNSLAILSERAQNSPKSGYVGYISDVKVLYHGDVSDMSATLKSITQKSDKSKAEEAKARNEAYASGYTDGEFTVDGVPLAVNRAVIQVYINVPDDLSNGDKVVYGAQLKSVVGEVMDYTMTTESGDVIDARMGAQAYAARIVNSLIDAGLRSTALDLTADAAVNAYNGN